MMMNLALAVALTMVAPPDPPRADPAGPGAPEGRRQAREDLAGLQGVWDCVSIEVRGVKADAKDPARTATYEGDRLTLKADGNPYRTGIVALDPGRTPKAMNTWDLDGPNKDKTSPAIYELDGDTLKLCIARPGDDRPAAFSSTEGTGYLILIYKRARP